MKKVFKQALSFIMVAIMIVTVIPLAGVQLKANATQSRSEYFSTSYTITGNVTDDILSVAQAQLGKTKSNLGYTEAWCADFVCDCAKIVGVGGAIPANGYVPSLYSLVMNAGGQRVSQRRKGDLIFYYCSSCGDYEHVGLVLDSTYSIEGNYNGKVSKASSYTDSSGHTTSSGVVSRVYVRPAYPSAHIHNYEWSYEREHPHREYKKCSCGDYYYTGAEAATYELGYEAVHPHREYNHCKICGENFLTGTYAKVSGCLECLRPGKAKITNTQTNYSNGVEVPIYWNSTSNTTHYNLDIQKQNSDGTYSAFYRKDYASSGDGCYCSSGNYRAIIGSYNSNYWEADGSDWLHSLSDYWYFSVSSNVNIKTNLNGGSGSTMSKTVGYNGAFSLSGSGITKTGYQLAGWNAFRSSDKTWYCENGAGWETESVINSKGYTKSLYSKNLSAYLDDSWINSWYSGTDTLTFYAVWNPNTLTVYYNANGGSTNSDTYKISSNLFYNISNNAQHSQTWKYNNKKENGLVNASTLGLYKEGYTFLGWSTKASGGTVLDENDVDVVPTDITSNINNGNCSVTLYAQWIPNSSVISYNGNGGSGDSITSQTVKAKNSFTIVENSFTKSGYTFTGWNVKRTTDSKWHVSGQGWLTDNEITQNGYIKHLYSPGETHSLDWSWTNGLNQETNYIFYAVWRPNTLSITYNANGAYSSSTKFKLVSDEVYYISSDSKLIDSRNYNEKSETGLWNASSFELYKDGYTFIGWGTSQNSDIVFDDNDVDIVPSDITSNILNGDCSVTLYAQWRANHTHNYSSVVTKDPTCTSSGIRAYTCSCGDTYTESIPASGHDYEVIETREPNCVESGYTHYRCSRCDDEYFEYTDWLGHDVYINETVEPSCSCPGYTEYKCSRCGGSIRECYINALGHDFKNGICSRCGIEENDRITVTFNISGGSCDVESKTVYYNDLYGELPLPAYDDTYRLFAGWYTSNGKRVDERSTVSNNHNHELTAKWIYVNVIEETGYEYLYGDVFLTSSKEDICKAFYNYSGASIVNYEIIGDYPKIGTETLFLEKLLFNDNVFSIPIIIFGDVNGDGYYDSMDSIIVNCLANGLLSREQVGEAVYMAADCNHDDVIDAADVAILEQAGLILASVDQSKSKAELMTDSAYVEYLGLIDQSPAEEVISESITTSDEQTSNKDNSTESTTTETPSAEKTTDSTADKIVNQSLIQKIFTFIIKFISIIKSIFVVL